MRKVLIIIAGVVVAAGLGFGVSTLLSNDDSATNQADRSAANHIGSEQNDSSSEQLAAEPSAEAGGGDGSSGMYIDYYDDVLANTGGDRYLFFHAPWCPQCRSIESGINSDGVPAGVSIIKVDYDTNQDLRAKYGVTLQTTFVKVDQDGELVEKFVAYDDPQFSSVVRDFISQ